MRSITMIWLLVFAPLVGAAEQTKPQTLRERFQALLKEYEAARQKAPDGPKVTKEYAARFLELAKENPADPAAIEALAWVIEELGFDPPYVKAIDLLIQDHIQSKNIVTVVRRLAFYGGGTAERLFRAAIDKNRDREVMAWSHFGLAQWLRQQAQQGKRPVDEAKKLLRQAEKHYEEVAEKYADVKPPPEVIEELARQVPEVASKYGSIWPRGSNLGDMAGNELFAIRRLVAGQVAPEIKGEDIDGKQFKLSDYRGKVVLLDFWGHW